MARRKKDMLRLVFVRDYTEIGCGKVYSFVVDENKHISIDTDKDNTIISIWFYDKRESNSIVGWFIAKALVNIDNIMSGIDIDVDKLVSFEDCFEDMEVEA